MDQLEPRPAAHDEGGQQEQEGRNCRRRDRQQPVARAADDELSPEGLPLVVLELAEPGEEQDAAADGERRRAEERDVRGERQLDGRGERDGEAADGADRQREERERREPPADEERLQEQEHADERGDYDNAGFRYRGHVFTDAEGRYRFRTIEPALYPGRTRHYHIKVLSTGRQLLTTQLYFPNEPMNARDSLFDRALVVKLAGGGDATTARFDFVLDMR